MRAMQWLPEIDSAERRRLLWLVLFAGLVRFWDIGIRPFEMVDTMRLASAMTPNADLGEQASVIHIGSYGGVLLLRALSSISESWWWLRLPYASTGTFNVLLLYLFVRRFFDERTALAAGWILACSPLHLSLSVSIEEHEFTCLFALVGTWIAMLLIEEPRHVSRFAPALAAVQALGLLVGGYLILGYWTVLAALVLVKIGRSLTARQWGMLVAAQVPMLAAFFWLLSYGVFAKETSIYVQVIRTRTAPILPNSPAAILSDVVVHVGSWMWKDLARTPVVIWEWITATAIVALAWQGRRRLRALGARHAGLVLGLAVGFPLLMAAIYLSFFGRAIYFARAYAVMTLPLFILLGSGLYAIGPLFRIACWAIFPIPMLTAAMMMWYGLHPGHLAWEHWALKVVRARNPENPIAWIHPGELAALVRTDDPDDEFTIRGVWRDPPMTPAGWDGFFTAMTQEEIDEAANRIADERACLIESPWFNFKRDPGGALARRLEERHGYRNKGNVLPIVKVSCPDEGSGHGE